MSFLGHNLSVDSEDAPIASGSGENLPAYQELPPDNQELPPDNQELPPGYRAYQSQSGAPPYEVGSPVLYEPGPSGGWPKDGAYTGKSRLAPGKHVAIDLGRGRYWLFDSEHLACQMSASLGRAVTEADVKEAAERGKRMRVVIKGGNLVGAEFGRILGIRPPHR
jgi:hypothetical protein